VTGPVTVAVEALDANSCLLAEGTATQQDLNVGGQTILVVTVNATACGTIAVTRPMDAGRPTVDAGDSGADAAPVLDAASPHDAGGDS
jgi:hypothetical protein